MSTTAIKVLATFAVKGVFARLEQEPAESMGISIAFEPAPPALAAQRTLDGELTDIVVSTPEEIDKLIEHGLVVEQSGRVIACMVMGVAVRMSDPVPDISTAKTFRQAVLNAPSLVHADPRFSPSAAHFVSVARKLGIEDEAARKTTILRGLAAQAVASGKCAMAVQQLAELMLVDGIRVVGPFPADLQKVVPLTAAVHAKSSNPTQARDIIDILASSKTQDGIVQLGLLPGSAATDL